MTIATKSSGPGKKADKKIQPKKKVQGRPSKLDKTLADKIVRLLGRGNPITVVCDLVGIHHSTYYNWQAASDEATENGDSDSILFRFSDRCKEAQAKAEEKALRIVLDAAVGGRKVTKTTTKRKYLVEEVPDPDYGAGNEGERGLMESDRQLVDEEITTVTEQTLPDARAAMWYLERRNRKEYGKQVGIVGPDGGAVQVKRSGRELLGQLADDDLETLEAVLGRIGNLAGNNEPGGSAGGDSSSEGP